MPELPDVEGFRTVLAEHAAGRRMEHVGVIDAGVLAASRQTAAAARHAEQEAAAPLLFHLSERTRLTPQPT
jgi:hypothetical protein